MSSLFIGVLQYADLNIMAKKKEDEFEFNFLLIDSAVYSTPDAICFPPGAPYHENHNNSYQHK